MSTQTEIGWFSKYKDVVKELHDLRKENDRLQAAAAKAEVSETQLAQLKQRLKELSK